MSCKIERSFGEQNSVVLRLSGQIDGAQVDTLRDTIKGERDLAALDLTEVMLVDHAAVRLFALSEADGIELRNCPAYIREWVDREEYPIDRGRNS
jgi:anti-anti-sigma regulatory factor